MNKIAVLICLFISISTSAIAQKKINGNGQVQTETRKTNAYESIKLIGSSNVTLVHGTVGELTVTAESNILNYLETYVENNELVIRLKPNHNFNTTKGVQVVVPAQKISQVTLTGSGKIATKNTTLQAKKINLSLSGSGDMELAIEAEAVQAQVNGSGDMALNGKTQDLNAAVKGSGDIDASKLKAATAKLEVFGSGDIKAQANNEVNAAIIGSGDIHVTGKPQKVNQNVKGSGSVVVK
ncbi:DUF2807 domain-containing protein [Flavobacterium agricola]|uniref:DUF2807 domain-containing protein n=1 Tax=Flavobacterium agricola TaxID=2870839 RepID=A0ABY6M3G8_9FLAO|nr:head GIN domain-containing protein [Flavobacterium agricola]UYW02442.1 DUF2807 domain-containing protein [Flavobacterium agricola]